MGYGNFHQIATRLIATFVLLLGAMASLSTTASADPTPGDNLTYQAGYTQTDGSCCEGVEVDGWRADITSNGLSPDSHNCLLLDVVAHNGTFDDVNDRQVEAGDARCGSAYGLDECLGGGQAARYVETWTGGNNYVCYTHGEFTKGTVNTFRVSRETSDTVRFRGFINGIPYEDVAGFGDQWGHPVMYGWAEDTYNYDEGGGCAWNDWSLSGQLRNVARFNLASLSWSAVKSATPYFKPSSGNCISVSGYSGEGFDVTR